MDDIAELSGNCTDAGAVMFALSALPLVESAEVWIEANSDVGSDEQSPAKILTLMMENMNQFPIDGTNPFNIIEP